METLVGQAREAHRHAHEHSGLARHYRDIRDEAIKRAYSTGTYSYSSLARQVGCSPELIAKIVTGRPERKLGSACPNCGRRRHDDSRVKCYLC